MWSDAASPSSGNSAVLEQWEGRRRFMRTNAAAIHRRAQNNGHDGELT